MPSPRELLEPFCQELALSLADSTVKAYRYQLEQFLEFLEARGVREVGCITPDDLAAYRSHLQTVPGKRGKLFSVRYQEHALGTPKAFFQWACSAGHILVAPEIRPQSNKAPHPTEKTVYSVRQIERLLEAPDPDTPSGKRDRAILEVFYSLGLRRRESLMLDLGDLNFHRQSLRVMGKGSKERLLPLSRRLCELLDGYMRNTRPHLRPCPDEQALWVSTYSGRRLTSESLLKIVQRYGNQVGLEGMHPHLLRHSCATHMLEGGADLSLIQRFLGHSEPRTTAHYAQVSVEELKREHRRCHPRSCRRRVLDGASAGACGCEGCRR